MEIFQIHTCSYVFPYNKRMLLFRINYIWLKFILTTPMYKPESFTNKKSYIQRYYMRHINENDYVGSVHKIYFLGCVHCTYMCSRYWYIVCLCMYTSEWQKHTYLICILSEKWLPHSRKLCISKNKKKIRESSTAKKKNVWLNLL